LSISQICGLLLTESGHAHCLGHHRQIPAAMRPSGPRGRDERDGRPLGVAATRYPRELDPWHGVSLARLERKPHRRARASRSYAAARPRSSG
jgi:hypothetical protein